MSLLALQLLGRSRQHVLKIASITEVSVAHGSFGGLYGITLSSSIPSQGLLAIACTQSMHCTKRRENDLSLYTLERTACCSHDNPHNQDRFQKG